MDEISYYLVGANVRFCKKLDLGAQPESIRLENARTKQCCATSIYE